MNTDDIITNYYLESTELVLLSPLGVVETQGLELKSIIHSGT